MPTVSIFDGFPRTVAQAEALDALMDKLGDYINGMVALDVPDKELKQRIKKRALTSGRVDDQDDNKINTRIQVYKDETLPVANYYEKNGKYHKINGVGTIETIFADLTKVIDQL